MAFIYIYDDGACSPCKTVALSIRTNSIFAAFACIRHGAATVHIAVLIHILIRLWAAATWHPSANHRVRVEFNGNMSQFTWIVRCSLWPKRNTNSPCRVDLLMGFYYHLMNVCHIDQCANNLISSRHYTIRARIRYARYLCSCRVFFCCHRFAVSKVSNGWRATRQHTKSCCSLFQRTILTSHREKLGRKRRCVCAWKWEAL